MRNHVVDDGGILSVGCNDPAEAQTHNTSWANSVYREAKLLTSDLCIANGDGVVDVVALDVSTIEVRDVETVALDGLEGRAVVGVNCSHCMIST